MTGSCSAIPECLARCPLPAERSSSQSPSCWRSCSSWKARSGPEPRRIGGPFQAVAGKPTVVVSLRRGWLGRCCLGARTDSAAHPDQSDLRVTVDGVGYPHAHAAHESIDQGAPGSFSYWNAGLRLTLPPGRSNDAETWVRVTYPVQILDQDASLTLLGAVALLLILAIGRALGPRALLTTLRRRRHLVSPALVLLFVVTLALECGAWRHTEDVRGPFAADPSGEASMVPIAPASHFLPLGARGDDGDATMRSKLAFSSRASLIRSHTAPTTTSAPASPAPILTGART